jgi:hypothetical protein
MLISSTCHAGLFARGGECHVDTAHDAADGIGFLAAGAVVVDGVGRGLPFTGQPPHVRSRFAVLGGGVGSLTL